MWQVIIVNRKTGETVETIPCSSQRNAERVEEGVQINLNHEMYCTDIEEIED